MITNTKVKYVEYKRQGSVTVMHVKFNDLEYLGKDRYGRTLCKPCVRNQVFYGINEEECDRKAEYYLNTQISLVVSPKRNYRGPIIFGTIVY